MVIVLTDAENVTSYCVNNSKMVVYASPQINSNLPIIQ